MSVSASDSKTMLPKRDIYAPGPNGKSRLHVACHSVYDLMSGCLKVGDSLFVEMLCNKVNKDFMEGSKTHLLLCAPNEVKLGLVGLCNTELAMLFLKNNYPINYHEPKYGFTALHCAISFGKFENAKMLIEHGADVDAMHKCYNVSPGSPFQRYTSTFEQADKNFIVLNMFLERSRCLFRDNKHDSRIFADSLSDIEFLLIDGQEKTIKTVLASGIDINARLPKDKSILYCLFSNNNLNNFDWLGELYAELRFKNPSDEGSTLLTVVKYGFLRKMEFLLDHGTLDRIPASFIHPKLFDILIEQHFRMPTSDRAKIIELLLNYGMDVQPFLSEKRSFNYKKCLSVVKLTIPHLAMLGSLEVPALTDLSRQKIYSKEDFKTHFDACTKQLEGMKEYKVKEPVTLFQLLTERDMNKLAVYSRSQPLTAALDRAIKESTQLEEYYVNTIRINLERGRKFVKLQNKAALAIEACTGLDSDVYYAIVYKIVRYLDYQDVCNLSQI